MQSTVNPKHFAAVIMRIRQPKTTALTLTKKTKKALIFAFENIVCTGAKSEKDPTLAARKYARIVKKIGINMGFKDF